MNKHAPSHLPGKLLLKDCIENEAMSVYLYKEFAVVEIKEGVTLSYKNGFSILVKGLAIMGTKPWIYISNRVNSYSVVPTDYKYLNKVPTLKGLVIVSPEKAVKNNAHLERNFFTKPFTIVDSIEDAYNWGRKILDKK